MAFTTIDDPEAFFQCKIYTGNGGSQSITFDGDTDLQPNFIWTKVRSETGSHRWVDTVKGIGKAIFSNGADQEASESNYASFDSDGFSFSAAGNINEKDISIEAVKKSKMVFLEGYLWDEGAPKKAFDKAINNANEVAMSLSDKFCVDRHKAHFLDLVKNKLDITFANEQEIMSLIDAKDFNEVINFSKDLKKLLVITRGEKGAIFINGDEVVENGIKENLKIVDLTGAGDLFAAGFLHGFINNLSSKDCLDKGTEMSSRVIQQIGARL